MMAIWQFCFYIIPKVNDTAELNYDELLSWKNSDEFLINIDFLEKSKSWSEEIIQYGNDAETCIEFLYENDSLEEINCRLDLRSLSKKMLIKILDYIKEIDGMIYYNTRVYPPDIEEVLYLIKCSNASKFCQNPRKYFEEI